MNSEVQNVNFERLCMRVRPIFTHLTSLFLFLFRFFFYSIYIQPMLCVRAVVCRLLYRLRHERKKKKAVLFACFWLGDQSPLLFVCLFVCLTRLCCWFYFDSLSIHSRVTSRIFFFFACLSVLFVLVMLSITTAICFPHFPPKVWRWAHTALVIFVSMLLRSGYHWRGEKKVDFDFWHPIVVAAVLMIEDIFYFCGVSLAPSLPPP